jgi:23S rRNA pseudouridine2605 synthase
LTKQPGTVRLHVFLARAGAGSRRAMEAAIRAGRVQVNGVVVETLGTRIDPSRAAVRLDGRPVRTGPLCRLVVAVHKPPGVITTARDPHGRRTVLDLLPADLRQVRLYPLGRLDAPSEGLVLLTNDGALAERLLHPRYGHEREYGVEVWGDLPRDLPRRFAQGVSIGDRRPARAEVRNLRQRRGAASLRLVLREGRNHQIRRMIAAVGAEVVALRRLRIATVRLGGLAPGAARALSAAECSALRAAVLGKPLPARR